MVISIRSHTESVFYHFWSCFRNDCIRSCICIPYRNAAVRSDCMWYGNAVFWNRIGWIYWKRCFSVFLQSSLECSPVLSKIPVLGDIFFKQNLLTYAMYFIIPLSMFYIYRTRYGLKLRALGENPAALDAAGENVFAMRYGYIIFGCADDVDQRGVRFAGKYKLEQRNDSRKRLDRICTGCIFILESSHADVQEHCSSVHRSISSNLQIYLPSVPTEVYSMLPCIATVIVFILSTGNFRKEAYRRAGSSCKT